MIKITANGLVGLGCVANSVALALFDVWMHTDYVTGQVVHPGHFAHNASQVLALSFATLLAPGGVLCALEGARQVKAHPTPLGVGLLMLATLVALVCGGIGFFTWRGGELVLCGFFFCEGGGPNGEDDDGEDASGAMLSVGALYALIALPLSLYFFISAVASCKAYSKSRIRGEGNAGGPSIVFFQEGGASEPLIQSNDDPETSVVEDEGDSTLALLGSVTAFNASLLVTSCFLPNTWSDFTPTKIKENLAEKVVNNAYAGAEKLDAVMSTFNIQFSDSVIASVFPDTLIFYTLVLTVPVIAVALRNRRREKIRNVVVAILLLTATALTTIYWFHDHLYEGYVHDIPTAETVGRGAGQMAVYVLALLILPISRTSVLNELLQVSWESVVYIHIRAGYLFIALLLTHIVAWVVLWAQDGTGPDDLWSFVWDYQSDNFTNPLVLVATYLTFFMGFMSQNTFRRKFFDFFYLLHQATFLMLTVATFWHAASSWYFLIPGVSLWMCDRWRRVGDKCVDVEVVAVGNSEEVAKLTVKLPEINTDSSACPLSSVEALLRYFSARSASFTFKAGQYAFLHIPSVSALAHPFTISSAPAAASKSGDGTVTFCCKAVSIPGQFTQALCSLPQRPQKPMLLASIEGPYGLSANLCPSIHTRLLLVAGGIGCTPCLSILSDFLTTPPAFLERVRFIWVVRHESMLHIAEELIRDCLARPHLFDVECYVTGTRLPAGTWRDGAVRDGRPDLTGCLEGAGEETQVFACGPPKLVEDTRRLARKAGTGFQAEEFLL